MKVYIVVCRVDLGYQIEEVFADEKKAEEYRDKQNERDHLVFGGYQDGLHSVEVWDIIE